MVGPRVLVARDLRLFLKGGNLINRLILPPWAKDKSPKLLKVLEGRFSHEQLEKYNRQGYNVYYLPNYPSQYDGKSTIDGSMVDVFQWVFVDCDLKDGVYPDKYSFLEVIGAVGI